MLRIYADKGVDAFDMEQAFHRFLSFCGVNLR